MIYCTCTSLSIQGCVLYAGKYIAGLRATAIILTYFLQRNADEIKLWKLLYRPPISVWTKDRAVLIGDASHPMLPRKLFHERYVMRANCRKDQGQGGAQAIEDGAALGALLSKLGSVEEVPTRLHLFQELRKNRAAAIQIFSNAGQDEAEKIQAEAQKYVDGPVPSV